MIWHILKKDLRQQRHWLLAVLALALLATALILKGAGSQMDAHDDTWEWRGAGALYAAFFLSLGVLITNLIHAEALPGDRQYWLARPIRRMDLLAAKAIATLAVIVAAVLIVHTAPIAILGLGQAALLPAFGKQVALITLWVYLPVGLLAAMTRNVQQSALWLVCAAAASLGVVSLAPLRPGFMPNVVAGGVFAFGVQLVCLGAICTILIAYVYRTRNVRWVRWFACAGFSFTLSIPFWLPARVHSAAWRATSVLSVPDDAWQIELDPSRGTGPSLHAVSWVKKLVIPVRIKGLESGWEVRATHWKFARLTAGSATLNLAEGPGPFVEMRDGQPWLSVFVPRTFFYSHVHSDVSISLEGYVTVLGPPAQTKVPVAGGVARLPGVGECRAWYWNGLRVSCLGAFWGVRDVTAIVSGLGPQDSRPVIFRQLAEPWPLLDRMPVVPLSAHGNSFAGRASGEHGDLSVIFEVRDAMARVERPIYLSGFSLGKYATVD